MCYVEKITVTTVTFDAIVDRAGSGYDLSPEEGVVLLKQTDASAIASIRSTADKLRYTQAGDTVTYVINRNINFTNICIYFTTLCRTRSAQISTPPCRTRSTSAITRKTLRCL
jgi:5-amino-6-(D-ribitylamino)uracil---L-tyrosine 4-hydroxyphenyl transferase